MVAAYIWLLSSEMWLNSRSVELGHDPSCLLNKLKSFLQSNSLDGATSNVILILLAQLFESSPHSYYAAITEIAVDIFSSYEVDSIVAGILVTPGTREIIFLSFVRLGIMKSFLIQKANQNLYYFTLFFLS